MLARGFSPIEVKNKLKLKSSLEAISKILDTIKEGRKKEDKSLKKFINANLNLCTYA